MYKIKRWLWAAFYYELYLFNQLYPFLSFKDLKDEYDKEQKRKKRE